MRGFKGYALVLYRVSRNRSALGGKGLSWVSNASLGFYTVWAAHLGRRYGILRALSLRGNGATVKELSRELGLFEPALQVWCEAAHSLGLLARKGARYTLSSKMRTLFVDEHDADFIGGQFSYLALRSLDFGAFDGFFRGGRAPRSAGRHLREATEQATRWDHTSFLTFLLKRVPRLRSALDRGARALDIGCGTGGWVLRMAAAFPKASFLGVDPDRTAIRSARSNAIAANLGDRVTFRIGTGESVGVRGSFDHIHLGEVLYGVSRKVQMLKTCRRALREGGQLVIAEGLRRSPSDSVKRADRLVAAMGLDFVLQGSRFFTRRELAALLRKSGFDSPRFHSAGGGLWFIVATARSRPVKKTPRKAVRR